VGIYGGSFNPIHNGHLALAEAFLKACALDEVWFVVSPQNPFKADSRLLDDDTRLRLTRMAVEQRPGLRVSDVEFGLPRPSYMWNTLQKLSHDHPDTSFTLLIGGDNWASFDRWHRAADILSHYPVAVYPRPDSPISEQSLPKGVTLLRAELLDISSTAVRQAVARGEDIGHMVPKPVAEAIRNEHLYQAK
jgi:nicotinate-nucleotide adenylyltransferase